MPELPYAKDARESHISAETLDYHYGKHHKTYVDKLNGMVDDTEHASQSLEDISLNSEGGMFNNAAQIWNHTFYWPWLAPNGGGEPTGKAAELINRDFGSFAELKTQFTQTAINTLGSGWPGLVQKPDGSLAITSTSNAETQLTGEATSLLTCDVWEHAFYIDYRNARPN
ncbi:MAG: Fe-Mn family superoxide dismutase [Pseudomonadota bacterium]